MIEVEEEKTGFAITCKWCGHNEVSVKPIDHEMCVLECLNTDCQETVHFMKISYQTIHETHETSLH